MPWPYNSFVDFFRCDLPHPQQEYFHTECARLLSSFLYQSNLSENLVACQFHLGQACDNTSHLLLMMCLKREGLAPSPVRIVLEGLVSKGLGMPYFLSRSRFDLCTYWHVLTFLTFKIFPARKLWIINKSVLWNFILWRKNISQCFFYIDPYKPQLTGTTRLFNITPASKNGDVLDPSELKPFVATNGIFRNINIRDIAHRGLKRKCSRDIIPS